MKNVLFSGKCKEKQLRCLCNSFKTKIIHNKLTFNTIEHAFQSYKYFLARHSFYREFSVEGSIGKWSAQKIKVYGTKGFMKKKAAFFDEKKWNCIRVELMKELLLIRYNMDEGFRNTLDRVKKKKVVLFHFERTSRSFWGGHWKRDELNRNSKTFIGKNMLGKLLMNTKNSLTLSCLI